MSDVFAFLFKYRPFYFEQGSFAFQSTISPWWVLVVLTLCIALLWRFYARRWKAVASGPFWVFLGMRSLFLVLLALLLLKPGLVLSRLVPGETLLAVVVDNSRSMGLEHDGEPRGAPLIDALAEESSLTAALEERFRLRYFLFDSGVENVSQPLPLRWTGHQTNIAAALERVLNEFRNLPLGGVVLFSDGSDNSYRDFRPLLSELQARRIPLHTVGVGPVTLERDVEMLQVTAPRTLIPETMATARVTLRQSGFGGSRGRLEVREGPSLIQTKEVHFPRGSETITVDVNLVPANEGVHTYRFSLQPLVGESIVENNHRSAVINVRNVTPRILYVEGNPRWEYKFLRQAVSEDRYLRLETLLRTALNKFYRQGIEEETILASGFPSDREELFGYMGLVLGNVESSFFSYGQMEMIRDFVSRRGGGFLMLGGDATFGAGAYQNTPVEEILPVWLVPDSESAAIGLYAQDEVRFQLTDRGARHPALQLVAEESENQKKWSEMPTLTDWNRVGGPKAGATVLAWAELDGSSRQADNRPLLAFQRYGRGHGLALLTSSSWRWQMLQDHRDETHQTFWRQMLRWLVSNARDPVTIETEREVYSQNEVVHLRAEVHDRSFSRLNDASVTASVLTPSGESFTVPLKWSGKEDGVYLGQWVPHEDGMYQVEVRSESRSVPDLEEFGRASTYFLTSSASREHFGAVQKPDFLRMLANETGGQYYTLSQLQHLPEEIVYTQSHSAVVEVLDLWDMPINLLLLLGLLAGEWAFRKRMGVI